MNPEGAGEGRNLSKLSDAQKELARACWLANSLEEINWAFREVGLYMSSCLCLCVYGGFMEGSPGSTKSPERGRGQTQEAVSIALALLLRGKRREAREVGCLTNQPMPHWRKKSLGGGWWKGTGSKRARVVTQDISPSKPIPHVCSCCGHINPLC